MYFFNENFYYAQNRVNGPFLGAKSTFFSFSLTLFIMILWNCIWWQVSKIYLKVTVLYFQKNLKNKKIKKIQVFHKICSLDFSIILCDNSRLNWRKNIFFPFFQDNVDYAQKTPLWRFLFAKLTCFIFLVSLLCFSW